MTWYARSGPRRKESGKFRSHAQLGTAKTTGDQYRGWSYSFIAHQTGSGVSRTLYAVSICDPYGNRVDYLRDFPNIQQATKAAHQRIDRTVGQSLVTAKPGAVGTIPTVPTAQTVSTTYEK